MHDRAEYDVQNTCTTSDGRYLTAGQRVELPGSVGDGNEHLLRVDAEPMPATLSLADARTSKRKKQSTG